MSFKLEVFARSNTGRLFSFFSHGALCIYFCCGMHGSRHLEIMKIYIHEAQLVDQ